MSSKISQRFEKLVLLSAIVGALGLASMVLLQARKLDDQFTVDSTPRHDAPDLPGVEVLALADESLGQDVRWDPAKVGERPVDLFTGINLFVAKNRKGAVDLLASHEAPVHPPIPNRWWIEHGLDPGYANSTRRDPDRDGFTNLEEFAGATDPTDSGSHPELARKLRLAELDTVTFLLKPSGEDGQGGYKFTYKDSQDTENRTAGFVSPGGTFFTTAPGLQRFRFKEIVEEQVRNERTNHVSSVKFALVEDLKPNKAGTIYKQQKGGPGGPTIHRDHTAVLRLAALGRNAETFRVEENTRFALPFDENAAEKPYRFKEVRNGTTVIIEWAENGEPKTVELALQPK